MEKVFTSPIYRVLKTGTSGIIKYGWFSFIKKWKLSFGPSVFVPGIKNYFGGILNVLPTFAPFNCFFINDYSRRMSKKWKFSFPVSPVSPVSKRYSFGSFWAISPLFDRFNRKIDWWKTYEWWVPKYLFKYIADLKPNYYIL